MFWGKYHKQVRKGRKLTNVLKEDSAYYVPLLQSIQNFSIMIEEFLKRLDLSAYLYARVTGPTSEIFPKALVQEY